MDPFNSVYNYLNDCHQLIFNLEDLLKVVKKHDETIQKINVPYLRDWLNGLEEQDKELNDQVDLILRTYTHLKRFWPWQNQKYKSDVHD